MRKRIINSKAILFGNFLSFTVYRDNTNVIFRHKEAVIKWEKASLMLMLNGNVSWIQINAI